MNYPRQQETESFFPARCYRHPDRETNVSCTRCERPICPDCLRPASVGYQCPECAAARGSMRQPTLPYGGKVVEQAGLVTMVLIALNVITFLVTLFTSPIPNHNQAAHLFSRFVLLPQLIADDGEYWRFLTSAFLHYGWVHLIVNMISLVVLGPALEQIFGQWRFGTLYLVSTLGGSVVVYTFGGHQTATAGASGAIFGLFGALVVVYRKLGLSLYALGPTILINVYITLTHSNISWLGHLGGFFTGMLVAVVLMHAPRTNRLLYQLGGVAGIVLLLVGLTVYRTLDLQAAVS